jgi:diacylglycerol kinase (ATP)
MSASSPARRVIVIYNPVAGQRRRRRFAATLRHLEALGCAVTVLTTARSGDAERLARAITPADCDVIAIAGGDGTINEVVNGLGADAPPFAVIPLGTANVIARELGLAPAPAALAQVIACGAPSAIHFAEANGRRFLQMAGIGFDARVVAAIDPRLKRHLGRAAYGAEILNQWRLYRPARYVLSVGATRLEASTIIVANGRFYGGPFIVDPGASLERSELGFCAFLSAGRWPLLRYLGALGRGALAARADIRIISAASAEIEGEAGEAIQLDGDIRSALPCRIRIAGTRLSVLAGVTPPASDRR